MIFLGLGFGEFFVVFVVMIVDLGLSYGDYSYDFVFLFSSGRVPTVAMKSSKNYSSVYLP